jgi:glycosyltransferase involved in cell wall biosynthesis
MLKHSDVEFHLWGPGGTLDFPDALAPRIVTHPWTPRVWDHYLRLNMDVGLAPLDTSETFNDTKSDIKLREYAALGIPFIATKSKAYTNTTLSVRGMVAESEREWEEGLEELYRNANLRSWMAEQGRLRARLWTTEENAVEWEKTYERAGYTKRLRKSAAGNGSAPAESAATAVTIRGYGDRAAANIPTRGKL